MQLGRYQRSPTVTPSESPQWVLGADDREYRPMADYDERYADAYVIDAVTGQRTLLAKKQRGGVDLVAGRNAIC